MIKASSVFKNDDVVQDSLRQEFVKAIQDKNFAEVVSNLNLNENILMKYTSRLKECSSEIANCHKCQGLFECKNKVTGFVMKPKKDNNTISFSYVGCRYTEKEKYRDNVVLFDVSREIKNASLSDVYTKDKNRVAIIKRIKEFYDSYLEGKEEKAIYLYGSFGTGKTYLISALLNEFAKKDIRSTIVHVPELLRGLKESFDSDYADRFATLKTTPFLLLDDIGAEYLTTWGRDEVLEPLLHYRMNEHLPTFFTSNLNLDELESHFTISNTSIDKINARRIIERIKKLATPIELISKNIRD